MFWLSFLLPQFFDLGSPSSSVSHSVTRFLLHPLHCLALLLPCTSWEQIIILNLRHVQKYDHQRKHSFSFPGISSFSTCFQKILYILKGATNYFIWKYYNKMLTATSVLSSYTKHLHSLPPLTQVLSAQTENIWSGSKWMTSQVHTIHAHLHF